MPQFYADVVGTVVAIVDGDYPGFTNRETGEVVPARPKRLVYVVTGFEEEVAKLKVSGPEAERIMARLSLSQFGDPVHLRVQQYGRDDYVVREIVEAEAA